MTVMNNFVLFVGAGASQPFGIPTMTEMTALFEEELQRSASQYLRLFNLVKLRLQDYMGFDIEALISTLQDICRGEEGPSGLLNQPTVHFFLSNGLGRLTDALDPGKSLAAQYRDEAKELLDKVKDFVAKTCAIKHEPFMIYRELVERALNKQGYKELSMSGPGGLKSVSCQIFTTNYDVVLEAYCDHLGFEYECGQEQSQRRLVLNEENRRLYNPEEPVHQIYKLHGSINWYPRRGYLKPYSVDAMMHHEEWFEPNRYKQIQEAVAIHIEPEPFLVPPILIKSAIVEQPILRLLWYLAYKVLFEAQKVTFVGYSCPLTDIAVRILFEEAVHLPPKNNIYVVNLASDRREQREIINKYREVFSYIPEKQFNFRGALQWARTLDSKLISQPSSTSN